MRKIKLYYEFNDEQAKQIEEYLETAKYIRKEKLEKADVCFLNIDKSYLYKLIQLENMLRGEDNEIVMKNKVTKE